MEINDIINFQQHLKYEKEDGEEVIVGFISAVLDKTNLQYSFNIQIFNKEFYDKNQELVDLDIINFYKEIGEYLSPNKQANLFKMIAYQE